MAIGCARCGGPAMLETVVKLRRGVLGFRETRWQRAYCMTCKLCSPVEHQPGAGSSAAMKFFSTRSAAPVVGFANPIGPMRYSPGTQTA